ncbi:hypothetical protein CNR37_00063 [Pseudomonas phage ventosus]|uniref:Uncharacterized protein n=1 Tax=Pseudomonas phage ventosus TaxID=2048980 RepID=A0A2H4P899_9CAUD|nr:hypothetical protein CNR37_00063 [Pseudomonas phage ventosus]
MSHTGMTAEQAQIYRTHLGSYVQPASSERIKQIRNETGAGLLECKRKEEKERMLAAIEEIRWESGTEYNSAMHTVLDVLQYLVERT